MKPNPDSRKLHRLIVLFTKALNRVNCSGMFQALKLPSFVGLLLVLGVGVSTGAFADDRPKGASSSTPKEDPLLAILHGRESSSAAPVKELQREDPLSGILADLHAADAAQFDDGTGKPQAPLERAISALNRQTIIGTQRLKIYKDRQRQTVLGRQRSPNQHEQAVDEDQKRAMNLFEGKLRTARSLVESGRGSRERCLSRDSKSQLDRGLTRSCDELVRTLTEAVGTLQEDTHTLDLSIATAGAGSGNSTHSKASSAGQKLRDPWARDTMTKW